MKEDKIQTLKFNDPLIIMVLRGDKNTTWRVGDDKNLKPGDIASLCRNDGEEFAKGEIRSVKKTLFKYLSKEDKLGHEKFNSAKDMYKTYSMYYGESIGAKTQVYVIKYELVK